MHKNARETKALAQNYFRAANEKRKAAISAASIINGQAEDFTAFVPFRQKKWGARYGMRDATVVIPDEACYNADNI
jgi:hypothetical protein